MDRRTLLPMMLGSMFATACGGGGGGAAPAAAPAASASTRIANSAEGLWTGRSADGADAALMVLQDGETWGVYTGGLFVEGAVQGKVTGTGTQLAGSLRDFNLGESQATDVDVSGAVVARSAAVATVQPGNRRVTLNYHHGYDKPASLASLAGTWGLSARSGNDVTLGTPVTIAADGTFTIDSGACTTTGSFTPRGSGKNVFDIQVKFTGACSLGDGKTARGIAMQDGGTLVALALLPERTNGFVARGSRLSAAVTGPSAGGGPAAPAPGPAPDPAPAPEPAPATPAPEPDIRTDGPLPGVPVETICGVNQGGFPIPCDPRWPYLFAPGDGAMQSHLSGFNTRCITPACGYYFCPDNYRVWFRGISGRCTVPISQETQLPLWIRFTHQELQAMAPIDPDSRVGMISGPPAGLSQPEPSSDPRWIAAWNHLCGVAPSRIACVTPAPGNDVPYHLR